ncbi:DUF732 domain-containing protein [Mycolicibacterium moriokaense]|nr:DUF732 domain-containing protein [Mycolicibacterium moriokaense]
MAGGTVTTAPAATADAVAYLVNVTVRPGYHFAGPQDALDYGESICAKARSGVGYSQLIGEITRDFGTSDEYQASYLITQAVNELCPAMIWQVRNSAAGYQPGDYESQE